jgi:hypothetical protein
MLGTPKLEGGGGLVFSLELTHREAVAVVLAIEAAKHTNSLRQLTPAATTAAEKVMEARRLFEAETGPVETAPRRLLGYQRGGMVLWGFSFPGNLFPRRPRRGVPAAAQRGHF